MISSIYLNLISLHTETKKIETNSDSLNTIELKEALVLIIQRKDELEDLNRSLELQLEEERLKVSGLTEKVTDLEHRLSSHDENFKHKILNIEQEV